MACYRDGFTLLCIQPALHESNITLVPAVWDTRFYFNMLIGHQERVFIS
jgi:hypothetical protein